MPKDWVIAPPWSGREALAGVLGVSPVVAHVLYNRGVADLATARSFLRPQFAELSPPESMPGAIPAARRIQEAIRGGERIVVFGDYDVDGITGVAILWHCLRLAGGQPRFYIPHRLEEGYGVNPQAVEALAADGTRLIITVDCGITAVAAAEVARRRGVDLIITDHHAPLRDETGRLILPEAMIVHPSIPGSDGQTYPNPDLSGSGVAFKLAWAVAQLVSESRKVGPAFRDFLVEATSLAALGIIADVVPLKGENRIIACHGLRGLANSRLAGVQALIQASGLTGRKLSGYDIGFKLAPRLNAIGRMGHARLAVDLLTRASPDEAIRIAANLDQQNRARQTLERKIAAQAREMVVAEGQDGDTVRAIVLASEEWHAGVVGIVASRLVEEFGRPSVLIALDRGSGVGQGSGRSIRHFPLHTALSKCSEHLLSFGGHDAAAGLKVESKRVGDFRAAFQELAGRLLTPADLRPKLHIDDVADLEELDERLVADLSLLEPFGAGNPSPMLATDWLDLVGEPRAVGAGSSHLQLTLGNGRRQCRGVAFGMGRLRQELLDRRRCRVAFRPVLNEWNGRRSVEMQIEDFQFPHP